MAFAFLSIRQPLKLKIEVGGSTGTVTPVSLSKMERVSEFYDQAILREALGIDRG